ncbi:MAG: mucoidy inhibitor MuiA family protein [Candidatus Methanoplasma sp.]|jgi:uncharacterized protein (TIGR02231 family)|nr:mucoidy inhibitor MuiA family protein [Candidatus Methanoplasma sp.]
MSITDTGSAVENVRIFLNGAEIKRRMVLDAEEGKNTAVFDGLPQDVRPESINASVEGGGTLLSADFEVDSFKESFVSEELKDLLERLDKVKDAIKEEKSKLDLLASEEKFLDRNMKIGGRDGFTTDGLKDIENYYKQRKEEISSSRIKVEKKLEDLQKDKERMTREAGAFPADVVRYAGRITVEFYAKTKGKAEVTVSYYVNSAWWRPFHEIRMSEINAPVTLSMKGSIVQNTGEDWNGVNVKLSTGNPMLGNEQPTLRPWYIDLVIPQRQMVMAKAAPVMSRSKELIEEDEVAYMEKTAECYTETPAAEVLEHHTTMEFALPVPLDIPSSNKPSKAEISKHVLEAEFFYYCASKLDTDAFLIAKIKGWESLNLLSGEISIFQSNEYVGKTQLDPATMEDSMEISLGRDKGIIVTRERGNCISGKGMIGKNKKALREWIITVRNTRGKGVLIKLVDQVPVSANSAVIVETLEISGAEHEKETGILKWSLNIPSGGSVKKTVKYEVTYPKNGTIYLD